ncbi:HSP20 family protein [Chitinivorax tropicus]|uniref:HSP20 family protein n=1 Tax=Chitinivorax tropicus TaxID=714531 RepID=A0A840MTS4_9PROT|nr:Hsp20/alpha crystallin family protein [Chitinivorax tropicus]MBB5020192.1 HSP20 family protein [Chitinivorax tropicus]
MANIRPAFDNVFDDLLKGFFVRPVQFADQPELQIKMDVKEDDRAYTVHADIPGVKKEDIHVTIDGSLVAISAEVKRESDTKDGEKLLRSERYYGKVSRSFQLAQDVDQSEAVASYKDGVLELRLPKRQQSATKRLTIS